ncbi:MAG: IreB family regulatory phosphoprotein [Lachnospiraceae bacterium]|nr:IreB family regulatory phosphoprotein [Lachnospiraceae bacterium]
MKEINITRFFQASKDEIPQAKDIIDRVYAALTDQGYNPVNQIVGYIMSGDPTYITSHNGARSLIMKVERDEILEVLLQNYIDTNFKDGNNK